MEIVMLGIAAVVVILILLYIIRKNTVSHVVKESESKNIDNSSNNEHASENSSYREGIYEAVQSDFKPYLQQLLQDIDAINELRKKCGRAPGREAFDAVEEIYEKAEAVEAEIERYWNGDRFCKDFSFYAGLHYASHLLGNAIKQEQQTVKAMFVQCKTEQKRLAGKIEELKQNQKTALEWEKSELAKEIADCCRLHKRISLMASQMGAANAKYNERVTKQHIQTGKRRDYIAENFGERGQQWKEVRRARVKGRD